jgi:hypothetical protein
MDMPLPHAGPRNDLGPQTMLMRALNFAPRQFAQPVDGVRKRGLLLDRAFREAVVAAEVFEVENGPVAVGRAFGGG